MAKKAEEIKEEVKTEEVKPETPKKGKGPIVAIIIVAIILLIAINAIVAVLLITKPWDKNNTTTTTTTAAVEEKVTITFNTNGGNEIEAITVNKDEQVTLPTPVYEGHSFKWWIDNDEIVYNTEATFEQDVTLNAVWEDPNDKTKTLKVTFDSKGGSSVKAMTFTCKDNAATLKNLPTPKKDAYEFRAWEDKHGKAILNGASITCDGDLKLYAAWEYDGPVANPEQNNNSTEKKWTCPDGFELNESTKKCTDTKKAEYYCEDGWKESTGTSVVCYKWAGNPTSTTCKQKNGYNGTYIPNEHGDAKCGYQELDSYIGQSQNCINNGGTLAANNHCYKVIELATESILNHTCAGTTAYRTHAELGNTANNGCYTLTQRTYGCKKLGSDYKYNYMNGKCIKTVDAEYK